MSLQLITLVHQSLVNQCLHVAYVLSHVKLHGPYVAALVPQRQTHLAPDKKTGGFGHHLKSW